jgi:serine/threonine protein kinase/tetratricopeptide (TPR) repeat protein
MTLTQGDRLGRYEILSSIGAGGMGEVWRARDTELNREVAVKVLPAKVADSPDRRKRFEREARATAALNHPNLLTVHDVGIDHDQPYIVTELLEGETLRRVLRHGPPPPVSAVTWSLGIANGLAAAHSRNVVHRDLKPDNVFLTTDNRVKILDFGLAKILETETADEDETAALSSDTAAGTLLGTMGYMAPEQLRGDPVDTRTDVFAFGCVLYEMLSGRRPFAGGSSADYVSAALRDDPAPLEDSLSLGLRAIVRRCLEKRPAARYQSAGELVAVLETLDPDSLGTAPGAQSAPPIRATSSGAEPAVAVMPFANLSNDVEQEYFCDGMTEEILGAIGKVRGLRVLARSSSFAFKGQHTDPRKIGNTIGADHLLEGSIQRAGNRIRIAARLVQTRDGTQLWADRYDRTISDIFELQDEISAEVANQLRTTLLPDELGQLQRRHIPDTKAYDLFLRGRYLWYRRREGDMMNAMGLYQQAIELDAKFPDPRVGLADALNVLGAYNFMDPRMAYSRALKLVEEALTLDPNLAAAHAVRGFIGSYHRFDWEGSERDYRRAIELDPNSAPTRCWYAGLLNIMGRHAEGAEQARKAVALEPMSPLILGLAGYNITFENVAEGLAHQTRAVEIDPNHPIASSFLAGVLVERLAAYEQAMPHVEHALAGGVKLAFGLALFALTKTGQTDRLAKIEAGIAAMQPSELTPIWIDVFRAAGQSDRDAYLEALARAVENGEYASFNIAIWSYSDFVRDDPRFHALLERIGLEDVPRCPVRGWDDPLPEPDKGVTG